MKLKTVVLLLVFSFISLTSFLIFRLNQQVIFLDLLFKDEVEVKVGMLILGSLIVGLLMSLTLEVIYFFQKKG